MPQFANTPESLLRRSDSRNPASTCRSINVNGKPCRRTLAAAPGGVVAVFKGQNQDPAAFYCWQHKNQASQSIDPSPKSRQAQVIPLGNRTSIDSLVERLGILDVNDDQQNRRRTQSSTKKGRENYDRSNRNPGRKSQAQQSSFCCFNVVDDSESLPTARRVVSPRHKSSHKSTVPRPSSAATPQRPVFIRDPRSGESPVVQHRSTPVTPERWHNSPQQTPGRHQYLETPTRPPPSAKSTPSQTPPLLSLIPQCLSPQTTALLLTELAKPISDADEEGYIYIFWVTPQGSGTIESPPGDIALNILPPLGRPSRSRRTSDALRAAQTIDPRSKGSAGHPGTIRLKIGRTSNVHRRLNEWSKQCSHNLTLIRYYPYTTLSPSPSPSPSPARRPDSETSQGQGRRVPHVHRVERLIHIELADQRVKGEGPCSQCGKEHREWFELNATKEALKRVDDCVRRWVSWGEQRM
jgi:Meiotically up-regulated gene 113